MADRIPQYPLMPNFSPALMQQQQAAQSQQPQPQPPHNPASTQSQESHQLAFQDQGRMWQVQQMQNQYRAHGGVDLNTAQTNPQVSSCFYSLKFFFSMEPMASLAPHNTCLRCFIQVDAVESCIALGMKLCVGA